MIHCNKLLFEIITEVCITILDNSQIVEWIHSEGMFTSVGEALMEKQLDFESLKPLRSYIKQCMKDMKKVLFADEIELEIH